MTTDGDATGSIEATTEYPSIGRFHNRQLYDKLTGERSLLCLCYLDC